MNQDNMSLLNGKNITLIISGGIAAYKTPELIRLIRKYGGNVNCILTRGGREFVTPLTLASVSGNTVYEDIFSLKDEIEIGHIEHSRKSDLVVIAPASANIIARIACGMADDLASAVILACNKPIMVFPSMNPQMWQNSATQNNVKILKERGFIVFDPDSGDTACGETGTGRMPEPQTIFDYIRKFFNNGSNTELPLKGKKAIVTVGATIEPIDPVRYISNYSSGKQGFAVAKALQNAGAEVCVVAGNVSVPYPENTEIKKVKTANEMLDCTLKELPCDIAVCVAAVADWRAENPTSEKLKKSANTDRMELTLIKNPDILKTLANHQNRPKILIGFAAETENVIENATKKLADKQCDMIVANKVGTNCGFGTDDNEVAIISTKAQESFILPEQSKTRIAEIIVRKISEL